MTDHSVGIIGNYDYIQIIRAKIYSELHNLFTILGDFLQTNL